MARKKSIMVQFSDEDPYGAIVGHTCAKQVVLSLNVFTNTEQSYQLFVIVRGQCYDSAAAMSGS